jgi:hypothetical protein
LEIFDGVLNEDCRVLERVGPLSSPKLVVAVDCREGIRAYEPCLIELLNEVCMILEVLMQNVIVLLTVAREIR